MVSCFLKIRRTAFQVVKNLVRLLSPLGKKSCFSHQRCKDHLKAGLNLNLCLMRFQVANPFFLCPQWKGKVFFFFFMSHSMNREAVLFDNQLCPGDGGDGEGQKAPPCNNTIYKPQSFYFSNWYLSDQSNWIFIIKHMNPSERLNLWSPPVVGCTEKVMQGSEKWKIKEEVFKWMLIDKILHVEKCLLTDALRQLPEEATGFRFDIQLK